MTTALIVVDVQESFRQDPLWAAVSAPDIADRVARLVDAARTRGDRIVWIEHSEPGSGSPFDPASGQLRLIEPLHRRDDEPLFTKSSINAFTTTPLQRELTLHGVTDLVVCGIQTELCCETTTRLAADLGYTVSFAIDATATFPIEHRDAPPGRPVAEILADPSTLGTDEIISRTEYALAGRFATIRTLDELTAPAAVR
jgi:nicotinamidase-related amidase